MATVTPVKYDETTHKHSPFVSGDVVPASDIQISPDSDNLLRNDGNGLLVKLEAAPDIANQYVSSSSGNDATGDGTQGNPFKTIRHALDRVPDYTSSTIWLKAGDTFRPEDGVSGYVAGGTLSQHTVADLAIGHRDITLQPYGNAVFDTVWATPGVDISRYEIGTQPIIIFTFSGNSDYAGRTTAPGFSVRGGAVHFTQITLRVEGTAPQGNSSLGTSPLAPWEGVAELSGCNIQTATGIFISGPADNTASGTINVHYCSFDNSRGSDFLRGRLGVTLKADLGDSDGSGSLPGHADIKTRVTNFNSLVAAHGSSFFPDLTVVSASARTYEGLVTTNNIIAATV